MYVCFDVCVLVLVVFEDTNLFNDSVYVVYEDVPCVLIIKNCPIQNLRVGFRGGVRPYN